MDAEAHRDELTQQIIELFVSIIGFIPREAVFSKQKPPVIPNQSKNCHYCQSQQPSVT